jgi:hypothetical protein
MQSLKSSLHILHATSEIDQAVQQEGNGDEGDDED